MRYYHNTPTGCAPKWEQIAQRIKKECDPGDPIIYGPGGLQELPHLH